MTSIDQSETGPLKTTTLRARQHQTPHNILIDNLELSYQATGIFAEQNTTNPGKISLYKITLWVNMVQKKI